MAAVAQYYSDYLRSEVLKGMDEKVKQGWPTGLAPYGYLNVDDRDEPVKPHPERAATLVRMFELYSTGSYTFESLVDVLANEEHIYRPSQPRFHRTALSYIQWCVEQECRLARYYRQPSGSPVGEFRVASSTPDQINEKMLKRLWERIKEIREQAKI